MKRFLLSILLVCWVFVSIGQNIETFLRKQPEFIRMEKIEGNSFFAETWEIMVRQPLDHSDTTKGFFLQRVFVADKSQANPVLLITEGYGANYASSSRYLNELTPLLQANQICVEHRYFGKSWPDSLNWDYLTVQNAAADHHRVTEILKKYYPGKWVNTGISKGGQTAVYHRTYFPADVDVTVAYVCPLNFGVEDGRHEKFFYKTPGTAAQRSQIKQFQMNVLKNRAEILPKLEAFSKEKNYTFRISMEEVLDYCVLEYPFALWQWGRFVEEIPEPGANVEELYNHLVKISSPSYFAVEDMESIKSFFVQAARELGYYGYDIKPFKKYLSIKTAKNYLDKIFLPENMDVSYNKKTARGVKDFIRTTNSKIIFIYGEFDPWTASGFELPAKSNFLKVVKPGGSHSSRIANLPPDQRKQVTETLLNWLELEVPAK